MCEPWEDYEIQFVRETYQDPEWTPKEIACKLERPPEDVYRLASRLGLNKPRRRLDWERIAELRREGLNHVSIATLLNCSKGGVARVIKGMGLS